MYRKSTTRRPEAPPTTTKVPAKIRPTTIRESSATQRVYVVNEIVNNGKKSSSKENSEEQDNTLFSRLQLNASDPASFGINWERVPYGKGFSNRVASISKYLILIMPILLVLLF